ncbi:MAG: ASPIC/UnbV domain-containing [Planctomycetota bacterium]|nr:MAG: ASPIC/UnbV domain-containing [Planctomycetota bacterium]
MSARSIRIAVFVLAAVLVAGGVTRQLVSSSRHKGSPAPPLKRPPWEWPGRPETYIRDVDRSETVHDRYASDVKSFFVKGLKAREWQIASEGMTDDFRGGLPAIDGGATVAKGRFEIREFDAACDATMDRRVFLEAIRSYVETWTSIDRATWKTFEFLLDPSEDRAWIRLHFQLAGRHRDGTRDELQGVMNGEVVHAGNRWKLRRLVLEQGCWIRAQTQAFIDVTDTSGFHFNESEENRQLSQAVINARAFRISGGLSCIDANGDGFPDLLATSVNRSSILFLNDGAGGFIRSAGPAKAGEGTYHFLVVDLDGDGRHEAVSTDVSIQRRGEAELSLYRLIGDKWALVPGALKFKVDPAVRRSAFHALACSDVNQDGRLDLFVGGYATNLSGQSEFNLVSAFDGADNLLFLNQGNLHFSEESQERGIHGTQYTLAAKFFDFDGNGTEDLLELNDFGPNVLWENQGHGRYREAKNHPLASNSEFHMGVTIADIDNKGSWSVYVSNMYSHAGNRIVPLSEGLEQGTKKTALHMALGNQLFQRSSPDEPWRDTAPARGVNWADWAWSCNFFDLDNDGDRDLFVTNGYTSNEDPAAPDW